MLDDLTLAELFTATAEIGDKYLSAEEIAARDAELEKVHAEIAATAEIE